ncbi:hypothetical protein [Microbulbifer thermotolerans]|uniref:hypothetical protein n=1 Tax=Microbulbifer thermotolerans TaxID=252514 RepID=UPI00224AE8B2|nr:hypothetical protein [Microbulbifer thermotolerans]MCX2780426.1 hypothetical protein [Microbulbifer thermotolerans]MCX2805902.1 hypothetical protein [Microbulbifer thermotolerans]
MADTYKFVIQGTDKTKAMFKSLKSNLGGLRTAVNSTATKIAGLAGVAGFGALVKSTITANTETAKLAESLNMSTKALSEWQYAGRQVNVEGDKMADIFKDVSDKIGDFAVTGGGAAADMFERFNLDVKELVNLSPDQQLLKIGEALDTVSSQSEKIFFMEALASDASLLLPLLENNAEGLRAMQEEAQKFGVSLSAIDAAKMEAANDSLYRAQQVGQGLANQLTVKLAPIIEELAVQFADAANAGGGMGEVVEAAFKKGVSFAGVLADGIRVLKILFVGAKTAAWGFGAAVVGAVKLAVDGVVALGNAVKNSVLFPLRLTLEAASKLPGVGESAEAALAAINSEFADFQAPEALQSAFDFMVGGLRDTRAELQGLLMDELPSQVLAQKVDGILAAADARAQEIAAAAMGNAGVALGDDASGVGDDGLTESEREQLAAKLETLKLSWLTELEQLQIKQDEEMAILDKAYANKLIAQDEYERSLTALEKKHQKERQKLEQTANKSRFSVFTSGASQILSAMASYNEKAAKLSMAAAVFETGVSLAKNVAKASEAGYPQNIPLIAGALAQGAEIAGMLSSLNAPSGASVGVSSTPSMATAGASSSTGADLSGVNQFAETESQQSAPMVNITIQGDLIGDNARTVAEQIKTLISEEDFELIPSNSRQAISLAG